MAGIHNKLPGATRKLRWARVLFALVAVAAVFLPKEVTSFSVGGSAARRSRDVSDVDLVDALSILQRERRRVRGRDFLDAEPLLDSRPFTPQDVSDWLRESRDNNNNMALDEDDLGQLFGIVDEPASWVSDGTFKGFAATPQTLTVKPSKEEIEDIFSSDDDGEGEKEEEGQGFQSLEEKKKKKKSAGVKQERRLVKKSVPSSLESVPETVGALSEAVPVSTSDAADNGISLEALTQEELKALMKAMGKLQKQVAAKAAEADIGEGEDGDSLVEELSESGPGAAVVQPASKEEIQSLFADENNEGEESGNGFVVEEEEVETPEGGSRVLEVNTPQGGRRVTEVDSPNGEKKVREEELPAVDMGGFLDVLEDSERELSDALASQLEDDISKEAVREEIAAEAEAKQVEEQEEKEAQAMAEERQETDEAMEAAKEEIARELGAKNLAALEKFWMSQGGDASKDAPSIPEKRTTKRAANSFATNSRQPHTSRDLGIGGLASRRADIQDILAEAGADDDDLVDRFNNREAEADLEQEILDEENLQDAMDAISGRINGEDIMYGSPINGDEFDEDAEAGQNDDEGGDFLFDLVPPKQTSAAEVNTGGAEDKNRITKERLQELAKTLSLNSFDDMDDMPEENDDQDQEDFLESGDITDNDIDLEPSDGLVLDSSDLGLDSDDSGVMLPKEVSGLPPPLGKFVTRIVELEDEVSQLRQIAKLADLENDVLTDALNEATLAQGAGTVSDMEFKSLQEAILVERELQKLKNGISIGDLDLIVRPGRLEPADDSMKTVAAPSKKGEPWRRKRGKVGSLADSGALESFPVSPLRRRPATASQADVKRLLGEAYLRRNDRLRDGDLDMDGSAVASIFLPDADMCPAVQRYSSNCELADLYSLPVDYEARALCNLHEMCYACGYSLHVPQSTCDEVYRAASGTLCRDSKACVLEAEIFLRTMKLKTRYVPHAQPACRSRCSASFLGMF